MGILLLGLAPAGAVLAQEAPRVTALAPTRNALTAARATPVAVTFSQNINPATGNNLAVYSSQAGGKKAGTYSTSGGTVTFDPTTDFKPGETVFVTVPATLQSTTNAAAGKHVFQFTTAVGGSGQGTFGGGREVSVNGNPRSMAVGDIDGDGDLDIMTARDFGGSVGIRLNDGSGIFSGNQNVSVGTAPFSITLGDVDGDGDLDLLSANASSPPAGLTNTVSVRVNNGTGAFGGNQNVNVGDTPSSVVTSDVDGDGDLDLLCANAGSNTVSVRLNNGTGTFSGNQNVSVGNRPQVVAVGDVDGDGDVDLLATNNASSSVSVRLNGGDATGSNTGLFSGGQNVAVSVRPQGLAVGDMDADGDLDLLAASIDNDVVSVRFNNGSGTFSGNQEVSVGDVPLSAAVGDVDTDGDLDLLTSNNDPTGGTISVRLNNGAGIFSGNQNIAVGRNPLSVTLGDVDADGDLDMLAANYLFNSVSVRLNQGQAQQVPTITSLSPAAELAGMPVTITGTNFTNSSTVSFGGMPASNVTYNSPTSLTAVVPASAAVGNSSVVVANAPGNSSTSSPAFEVLKVYDGSTRCLTTVAYPTTGDGAWHYLLTSDREVVAALQDTRSSLGSVEVSFQVINTATPVREDGRGHYYLDRNFAVLATNGDFPNNTVNVRFYGLNRELARLQTVDPSVNYANLKTTQYNGSNEDCELANDDFIYGEFRVLAAPASMVSTDVPWFVAEVAVADHFSEFYLTGSAEPLPVELTSFTAKHRSAAVQLRWRTASEQNSARFEVERSRDGRTFQPISQVAAQGTSTRPTDYTFSDAQYPADVALLYYRLRQVDQDGTATYSPVRTVALGDVARTLRVYPNPAHSQLTVTGVAPGAVVEVFDATGRRVVGITADALGTKELRLPDGLPAGVYLVRSGAQSSRLAVE